MNQESESGPHIPREQINPHIENGVEVELAVVRVTPERAHKWLKYNHKNRPVRADRVDRYKDQMEDGGWLVSPDAIAFSYTGKLINGQHRLKAISRLEDGKSVQCIVAFGLEPAAFKISDVGIKRTGADVLRIEGFKNAREMAAVCRLLALWKQDRLEELHKYETVENSTIVDIATACRERLTEAIEKTGADKGALADKMPRSLMAFAYFAYKPTFPEAAENFFNGFVLDREWPALNWAEAYDEPGAKNPVATLKTKMRRNYEDLDRKTKLAYLIKAYNAYCLEKPIKQLRWRRTDSFPEIAAEMVPELAE